MLWDDMVSLPLYAEPTVLVWSRTIGGVNALPRSTSLLWYAQLWAVRAPESTSNTTPSLPGQQGAGPGRSYVHVMSAR